MTPTLEDVARRAGVSTATVSRCLNAPEKVIESTRTRVLKAVEELGYSPHFGARAMAARRTNTIGAVVPTLANAIFAEGLQAFQESLTAQGYDLLVASSSYQPEEEAARIRSLIARGADGLLLIGHDRAAAIRTFLDQRKLPVVVAWAFDAQAHLPSVGFDNEAAMRALADQVLAMGHRQIGYITAPTAHNDRTRARLRAIQSAMTAAGLSEDHLSIAEAPYGLDDGHDAFHQMMQGRPRPSVIMCANDVLAVGALSAALQAGLRVPEDISITGFDDMALSRVVQPALTTVRVPHNRMGKAAAQALIQMIEGRAADAPVELTTNVVMRGSLAPPAGR